MAMINARPMQPDKRESVPVSSLPIIPTTPIRHMNPKTAFAIILAFALQTKEMILSIRERIISKAEVEVLLLLL